MQIYLIGVDENDCRVIVDRLQYVGRAIDVILAARIEHALDHDDSARLELVPPERDAILSVLDDAPESLVGLRNVLWLDRHSRTS